MAAAVDTLSGIPWYADLPVIGRDSEHHSWDVFGRDDELGTVNFTTPSAIVAAAAEIQSGKVVCLSLPLDLPSPSLADGRPPFRHEIIRYRGGRDDLLDGFALQCSSQWDGLQHIRYREFGYYGGRSEEQVDAGQIGVDVLARNGIIGRGVLADVAGYLNDAGTPIACNQRFKIGPALLDKVLDAQGVSLRVGDILLVRTGWLAWYLSLDGLGRAALAGTLRDGPGGLETPGLDPARETAAWLWDHRVAATAADNPAVEALQIQGDEGFLHRRILSLLGMPIGEFFALDELASACRQAHRWSFFFTSAPLNLPAGVGSPNNSYALF
jgi:hypothetical protein